MIRREDRFPLTAVVVLLGATAAWWAFALWPMPTAAPGWLERARYVCFNTTETGLPDRSGWILLVGQPLGMLALLVVGWGRRTAAALRHLASSAPGRWVATTAMLLVVGGLGAAGARVVTAAEPATVLPDLGDVPDTYPRLDRTWPVMAGLVDQDGEPFRLERLEGRRALVTFAFAHCETICPLVVRNAMAARKELAPEMDLAVVALTLDPWRDTPSRLPEMARDWSLDERDFALSGEVEAVEAALTAWNVARVRDEKTGDVVHPALVYLVEADGTVAYASTGAVQQLVVLARRMR